MESPAWGGIWDGAAQESTCRTVSCTTAPVSLTREELARVLPTARKQSDVLVLFGDLSGWQRPGDELPLDPVTSRRRVDDDEPRDGFLTGVRRRCATLRSCADRSDHAGLAGHNRRSL